MRVWRGDKSGGQLGDYVVPVEEEVVLDAIHRLQATQAGDLAVRWNCKAGKCGSCSAEINGRPRLMCMTRLADFDPAETITVTPIRAFPVIRDLVTDVSYNYEKAKELPAFEPTPRDADGKRRMAQADVERGQEFRKCIECFLCQNACHVIRDHDDNKPAFAGPRFFLRYAELDMHPLGSNDRRKLAQDAAGLGMCNITKYCTEVCPEGIKITDNAIIPMKERVVDRKYDPVVWLGEKIFRRSDRAAETRFDQTAAAAPAGRSTRPDRRTRIVAGRSRRWPSGARRRAGRRQPRSHAGQRARAAADYGFRWNLGTWSVRSGEPPGHHHLSRRLGHRRHRRTPRDRGGVVLEEVARHLAGCPAELRRRHRPAAPRYRHVLLVMPAGGGAGMEPVLVYAGGILWYGPSMLFADTRGGIRSSTSRHLPRTACGHAPWSDRSRPTFGYRYVLHQPDGDRAEHGGGEPFRFSFMSLDRSGDHQLIAGVQAGRADHAADPLRHGSGR